ncbi:hypothetical protein CA850_02935 [Micromonospora echinospora]|uniref:Kynurenine 3-monooxygenase n=1 Tax=Micromonospora echinospora TaxID=1877 RepID=A0A1C5A459_MICEC|nr:NAD(P)/FAD-dependent oxidoreductase [Micromonospora echinospora]OZV83638.1 hypothetical protein CA850_02935 [Micromonospora echinospora]SCF39929.1 kynurenine 3-monooxygenase [Micromonospora echinospora]
MSATRPKAVIVGAGPVGCLLAVELRRRDFEVELYEKCTADTALQQGTGRSFNLTLTHRGLSVLHRRLRERIYETGTILRQRIVHHRDGTLTHQPYGVSDAHHLLSVPRRELQRNLLAEARAAGAEIFFGHACVGADAHRSEAMFVDSNRTVRRAAGDILIGCDGANSALRYELSKTGARMQVHQRYISHGHVEVTLTAEGSAGLEPDGMHLWPRTDHFLQAQPNRDGSATTTLFMPVENDRGELRFRSLTDGRAVRAHFEREYPDIVASLPYVAEEVVRIRPALLKVVDCAPYNYGRAVLVGDSAHTIVPFFGQGINCSFEDAAVLCELLDKYLTSGVDRHEAVRAACAEFSERRVAAGQAISQLSMENLHELSEHIADEEFHRRKRLERRLHERHPAEFTQLYQMVAFTRMPYDEIVRRNRIDKLVLDTLCGVYDPDTQADKIIGSYPEVRRGLSEQAGRELELALAATTLVKGDR